jgi:hypothetical protein
MAITNLIVGLFLIGIGFLVKSSPNLIAGYNTMPADKKKNVNIDGLSTFMRNGLIAIGLSIIVGYYLFYWIGLSIVANSIGFVVTIVGVIILVIGAQKFDHNRGKSIKPAIIGLAFTIAFVAGLLTYGFIPTKITDDNDLVRFTGMYGFKIKVSDIQKVELTEIIPTIITRTNGFSLGNIQKGYFKLSEFGKCKLFLQTTGGPYLIITGTNNAKTIINNRNPKITEDDYTRIKGLIEKKQ